MHRKNISLIVILTALLLGCSGVISVSAAGGQGFFGSSGFSGDMGGAYFTDPSFLSPDWTAAPVTSTFADPSFLSKDWAVPNLNSPSATGSSLSSFASSPDLSLLYTDPSFLSPGWKVPAIIPVADSSFLSPNWSVPAAVPFGYGSLPDNWPYTKPDPFKSDSQFGSEWTLSGNLF